MHFCLLYFSSVQTTDVITHNNAEPFFLRVIFMFAFTARCTSFPASRSSRPLHISAFQILLIGGAELQSVPSDLAQTQLNAERQSTINLK